MCCSHSPCTSSNHWRFIRRRMHMLDKPTPCMHNCIHMGWKMAVSAICTACTASETTSDSRAVQYSTSVRLQCLRTKEILINLGERKQEVVYILAAAADETKDLLQAIHQCLVGFLQEEHVLLQVRLINSLLN